MRLTSACAAVGLVLLLSSASFAAAPDLAWIGQVPGLKPQATSSGQGSQGVYTLTGEPGAAFDALRAGFVRNGWTVEKSTNVAMAGLRTLVAVKDGVRAKAVLTGESLVVDLAPSSGGAAPVAVPPAPAVPPAADAPAAPAAPPAPARPRAPATSGARPAGPQLEISSPTTGTWVCEDTYVKVRSRDSHITLEGHCREIAVHGTGNRIDVRGRVSAIETHGRDNVVTWSAAANPSAPRQEVHGQGNKIDKVE